MLCFWHTRWLFWESTSVDLDVGAGDHGILVGYLSDETEGWSDVVISGGCDQRTDASDD